MQAGDVTAPDFLESLGLEESRSALIVAEGMLYYLQPHDGEGFFKRLATFACDIASPLTVRLSARGNIRNVRARYRWGVHGPQGILQLDPRFELIETYDFFDHLSLRFGS